MVVGAVQRGGKVKAKVVPQANTENVQGTIYEFVQVDSTMVTDEAKAYNGISRDFDHHRINHSAKEYVRGHIHTNTIEGFWNLLKKQINGIHHSVSPKHLPRYCSEAAFRYNNKGVAQDERFVNALRGCEIRLKYKDLVKKTA